MELITGSASEAANDDAGKFFAGTTSPRHFNVSEALLDRAQDFLQRLFESRVDRREIREAFTTDSFTLGIFAAIDTRLMAQYEALPSVWRQYTDVMTVNDFRPTRLLDKWFQLVGLKLVPERTEYPTDEGKGKAVNWINVAKYGLRDAVTWEAFINNDAIGEIQNMPDKYARAASETEAINALANLLLVDPVTNLATDVNTQFFKAGNNNAPTSLPLTADNLDTVLTLLSQKKPASKNRLVTPPEFQVVIPFALKAQMQKILNLREIRQTSGGTESVYDNYLKTVDYVVEPMLDAINGHANAATTWFVLPKPGSARPASFAAFLRGHETPDMRYKASAGQRFGGGDISPLEGSFEVDDIQTRVRHVLGHQVGDPTFTYVSRGA